MYLKIFSLFCLFIINFDLKAKGIVEIIRENPNFSTFYSYINNTELEATLQQKFLSKGRHEKCWKKPRKPPPQKTGVGGKGTCCLGARGNARFFEKWGQNLVFLLFFENSEKQAPVKGGFGGSQMTSLMSCRALYMQIYYA